MLRLTQRKRVRLDYPGALGRWAWGGCGGALRLCFVCPAAASSHDSPRPVINDVHYARWQDAHWVDDEMNGLFCWLQNLPGQYMDTKVSDRLETHVSDRWCVPACYFPQCLCHWQVSRAGSMPSEVPCQEGYAETSCTINYLRNQDGRIVPCVTCMLQACKNWLFFQLLLMVALWYYHGVFDRGVQFFTMLSGHDGDEIQVLFSFHSHEVKGRYIRCGSRCIFSARVIGRMRRARNNRLSRQCSKSASGSLTHKWCLLVAGCLVCMAVAPAVLRFGEALNPGPDGCLDVMTVNPATVLDREDSIAKLGQAIIGLSETAATSVVQSISSARWRTHNCQVEWSAPVRPYATSKAELRGLAGGAAIVSPYPLRKVVEAHPRDIVESSRYCEVHVQFAPHRFLQCISMYGPTAAFKYADHNALRNRLFTYAVQRVLRFKGPATIMGDMNASLNLGLVAG